MRLLLAFFAFAAIAAAQDAPSAAPAQPAPELSAHDEPASFKSRVNLVTVPVVVRDAAGHAVGNLSKEDFQLFDKGKPQVISRFNVERRERAPTTELTANGTPAPSETGTPHPEVPQQFVAYLFDDVHLDFADLVRVRNAADRNILATLGPETRIAIFTTSGQGNLDFTDDRIALHQAIMALRPHSLARTSVAECPDVSYYMADLIVNNSDPQALQAATLETIACENLDPKTMMQVAERLARSAAQRRLQSGEQETHVAFTVIRDVVRRISVMPGQRMILLTSPGFLVLTDVRPEETDVLERAVHANVVINSLDGRGLYTDSPAGDIAKPQYDPDATRLKSQYDQSASRANADIMAELAYGTGGNFYENSNDLDRGYRQLASAPEFVYMLSFSPQNLKLDGSFHRLKVTVRAQKLALQARRGYYAPTHAADPVDTAKQEIAEALYSQEEIHELPVDLHTQFFKSSETDAKLSVLAHLDLKRIQFRKAQGRNNEELTIVAALFDRNGNYIKGTQKDLKLHLRDETLAARLDSGLTVKTSFDVKPGSYLVRLVVRDGEAQQMAAASGAVEIP
jgi:VWFA-related protein